MSETSTTKSPQILISGAGPTGLSAALFLLEKGIRPRIIERHIARAPYSKAFVLNVRTLSLLRDSGVRDMFLERGRRMTRMNFWKGNRLLFTNDLSKADHPEPFLVILSQQETEEILEAELVKRGLEVEHGVALETVLTGAEGIQVDLVHDQHKSESLQPEILFAADGAGSVVRKQLDLEFKGHTFKSDWELYDVELETSLPEDEGHILIKNEGSMILIRIKDNIWRLAGSFRNLREHLPDSIKPGRVHWESQFTVNHRVAARMQMGNICLGGDAAHVHSPLGGRGMNLGIQDAAIFAELMAGGRLENYEAERKNQVRALVRRVRFLTALVSGPSFPARLGRDLSPLLSPLFGLAAPFGRKFILDI